MGDMDENGELEEAAEEGGGFPVSLPEKKRPLDGVARGLTDQDLRHPGTIRMILGELDRLNEENRELRTVRDWFHVADRDRAVLRARLHAQKTGDVLGSLMLALGGTALGLVPAVQPDQRVYCGVAAAILLSAPTAAMLKRVCSKNPSKPQPGRDQ